MMKWADTSAIHLGAGVSVYFVLRDEFVYQLQTQAPVPMHFMNCYEKHTYCCVTQKVTNISLYNKLTLYCIACSVRLHKGTANYVWSQNLGAIH